jgi:hypothetical protein
MVVFHGYNHRNHNAGSAERVLSMHTFHLRDAGPRTININRRFAIYVAHFVNRGILQGVRSNYHFVYVS